LGIDGILNVNKPQGKTSFQVVSFVRRVSGERRVGHGGTLDPEATGVLPVCLGRATRLVEFLAEAGKTYRGEIELGISTDTYDATGSVVRRGDATGLTRADVEGAVAHFVGVVEQLPPAYSAIKYKGVPLYRWARAGIEVPRRPRRVEFCRIELLQWLPPVLTLEIECSKGAYIRSLAHDIGDRLGCGAHLKGLVRLRSGPFHIGSAVTLPQIEEGFKGGTWAGLVHPMDVAVLHLPAVTVSNESEAAIANGRRLVLADDGPSGARSRAYSEDGRLIAILRYDPKACCWWPDKVVAERRASA
jgi:tRNA pseudouridine55 synthase